MNGVCGDLINISGFMTEFSTYFIIIYSQHSLSPRRVHSHAASPACWRRGVRWGALNVCHDAGRDHHAASPRRKLHAARQHDRSRGDEAHEWSSVWTVFTPRALGGSLINTVTHSVQNFKLSKLLLPLLLLLLPLTPLPPLHGLCFEHCFTFV